MTLSLFGTQLDPSLHELFADNGPGLPDRVTFDPVTGKKDIRVLIHILGFNRAQRKVEESKYKDKAAWNCHDIPAQRAKILFMDLAKAYLSCEKKHFTRRGYCCWETYAFKSICSDWYGPRSQAADRSLLISEADRETLLTLLKSKQSVAEKAAKTTKLPIIPPSYYEKPWYAPQLMGMAGMVFDKLDQWDQLDDSEKEDVADAAYACVTPFSLDVLLIFVTKQRGLLDYYTEIVRLARARKHPEALDTKQETTLASEFEIAAENPSPDLKTLVEHVSSLLASPTDDLGRLESLKKIYDLLSSNLPGLVEEHAFGDRQFLESLHHCVECIIRIGKEFNLVDFSEPDFLSAFSAAWHGYWKERLQVSVDKLYFETLIYDLRDSTFLSSSELRNLSEQFDSTLEQIRDYNEKLNTASYAEKIEIKKQISTLDQESFTLRKNRESMEESMRDHLLPPEYSLEAVILSQTTSIALEDLHPDAISAVKRWREYCCASGTEPSMSINGNQAPDQGGALPDPVEPDPVLFSACPSPLVDQAAEAEVAESPATEFSDPQPDGLPVTSQHISEEAFALSVVDITGDISFPEASESPESTVEPTSAELPSDRVDLDSYFMDTSEACERIRQCQRELGDIPAIAVDNLALLWIAEGLLPLAHKTLQTFSALSVQGELLPAQLLQAAYQGSHSWRSDTSSVLSLIYTLLPLSEKLEEWSSRRPGGRVVPYLVFAATFQPALFAGNQTSAPRLLKEVSGALPPALGRVIEELVAYTSKNNRVDIESLRDEPRVDDRETLRKLRVRITEWYDRLQSKQSGWAPVRLAVKNTMSRPEFNQVIHALSNDEAVNLNAVAGFIERYRNYDDQIELMVEEVGKVDPNTNGLSDLAGNARNWFLRTLSDLLDMADEWVEIHQNQNRRGVEGQRFARKLLSLITAAQEEVDSRIAHCGDLEALAGLLVVKGVLNAVLGKPNVRWEPLRVSAWFQLPDEWLGSEYDDNLQAQADAIISLFEKHMDCLQLAEEALAKGELRHAYLLLKHYEEQTQCSQSDKIAIIERHFSEKRRDINQRILKTIEQLDNANVAALMDDVDHYRLRGDLEHLQERLTNQNILEDLSMAVENLDAIVTEVSGKFATEVDKLRRQLATQVSQAQIEKGTDWIPKQWLDQFNEVLEKFDTTVAEEMLEHLNVAIADNTPPSIELQGANDVFMQFLRVEEKLYETLSSSFNPRGIVQKLGEITVPGLDLSRPGSLNKRGIEALLELRNRKIKTLDRTLYDTLCVVLESLGFELPNGNLTPSTITNAKIDSHQFITMFNLEVKRDDNARGLQFFSEKKSDTESIRIIIANQDWDLDQLQSFLQGQNSSHDDRLLLISSRCLKNHERNLLASYCKRNKLTLLHVDPVMLTVYMGRHPSAKERLKTFLQLSLPWTYSNPYRSNSMQPAPPEMRYGKQNDLQLLGRMRNGAAILFGGRQLGKTTLLKETVRLFEDPSHGRFAYLKQMDGNMDRKDMSKSELEKHRNAVWREIGSLAERAGILKGGTYRDPSEIISVLQARFEREGSESLLVCFDEIDPILGLDAANNFKIFREISGLVNHSNGRFKVIIAGLENVRRFADAPNYPLHQLGTSIQVSIMQPAEATQLIREPLENLGYTFETPQLIHRILVETNRHPGLIHAFCHELVDVLSNADTRERRRVGEVKITPREIDKVRTNPKMREIITDRFDITLNLDNRYKLIAYSLIAQSQTTFTPSRAKAIAEDWAPQVFKSMTEAQFEAFLDELCGLGVLQFTSRYEGSREYALRNTNIINLVGGPKKIEDRLLAAIKALEEDDPSAIHPFPDDSAFKSLRPSPLTLRDEKLLIADEKRKILTMRNGILARSSLYSVGIISGSEALGLNIHWMIDTLLAIGLEEPLLPQVTRALPYKQNHNEDTSFKTASEFRSYLTDQILGQHAINNCMMVFIECKGNAGIDHVLNLLDVAHSMRARLPARMQRVRVIFLLSPKMLWEWESHPDLTKGRANLQPFITLDLWKRPALAHLLNRLQLENTETSLKLLQDDSLGWYFWLEDFVRARKERPEASRVEGLESLITPLLSYKPRQLALLKERLGLLAVSWVQPTLTQLIEVGRFDAEDFELALMDVAPDANVGHALQWLSKLRLIDPIKRGDKIEYELSRIVVATLKAAQAPGAS